MLDPKEFGFFCENLAARYLHGKGYQILARNYRKPWGEIDIIAKKEDIFVFVEVKANQTEQAGFDPELRVNPSKLAKIKRTAALCLEYEFKSMDSEWQIDIVSISLNQTTKKARIKHFKNI